LDDQPWARRERIELSSGVLEAPLCPTLRRRERSLAARSRRGPKISCSVRRPVPESNWFRPLDRGIALQARHEAWSLSRESNSHTQFRKL